MSWSWHHLSIFIPCGRFWQSLIKSAHSLKQVCCATKLVWDFMTHRMILKGYSLFCQRFRFYPPHFAGCILGKMGNSVSKKSWCGKGSAVKNKSGRNPQDVWGNSWYNETQQGIPGRDNRRICYSSDRRYEIIQQYKEKCPECLIRKNQSGQTEWFHRDMVCMTIGKAPHVILGAGNVKVKGWIRER